jgi:hypothetical protein
VPAQRTTEPPMLMVASCGRTVTVTAC